MIVGVDEAGRGPVAGPLAVAGVRVKTAVWPFSFSMRDSKKMTEKMRNEAFEWISQNTEHEVVFIQASKIDKYGIRSALSEGVSLVLQKLYRKGDKVLLDGSLSADEKYKATTIVKGDEKETAIAMASVVAKVSRDRFMIEIAKKYPEYGFEKHKGYATASHRKAIKEYGLCLQHRQSFCGNFV